MTGVQTCALPICAEKDAAKAKEGGIGGDGEKLSEIGKNIKREEVKVSVYVFSQAIGHTTDSINYMRIYKEQMLGETSASIKYIFPEIPEQKWINRYTKAGIDVGQLVSMYQCLTDNHTLKLSIKTEKKLDELKNSLHYTGIIHLESEIRLVDRNSVV